jgi:hypothetical protein
MRDCEQKTDVFQALCHERDAKPMGSKASLSLQCESSDSERCSDAS